MINGLKLEYNEDALVCQSNYVNGKLNGISTGFSQDGKIIHEYLYENDKRQGICKEYHANGMVK